ncbi:APC amino acid permease [Wolfiporia cocos MD-104 SS10]|uniref:APC amino acid permease n=1 Tax=Wolfiporia cocos (strain MD-104) TaxID=742152 RepID=A0A2H3JHP7_WOLCO|nr:APC amino acid permease [Wolfiporia cocos MD-104 SS10]
MASQNNTPGGKAQDEQDAIELARLGYKQEFKRSFYPLEVFGLVFSGFGLVPSISSVLTYALPNGGPCALVWGWAVSSCFICSVAVAMAELGSAAPTAGGLYYWAFQYASPRWRRLLAWVVGYSNTIGNIAGVTGVDWGCALQIMAAVNIGSNQTFSATIAQTFGVFTILVILHAMIASLATPIVARLQTVYVVLNVLLCLAIMIALPAATPAEFRNPARYAFGGLDNLSGWPDGFAFLLSFLAPMWTIIGFDSSLHISEEATNARKAVPLALISAASLAGLMGWAVNVAIAFRMGTDMESIMDSPIDQPMAVPNPIRILHMTILFNSLGRKGTLIMWSFIITAQFFVGANTILASSRQVFAFARDGGLPLSRLLYRVNAHTQTPVNCAWFVAVIAILLGLLAFAGTHAISAVYSLGVCGQYIAYIIPIASRFAGGAQWRPGPFSLGRWGLIVAIIAVLWMVFAITILVFPSSPGPTSSDMNYTIAVLGGWLFLCLAYYYFPVIGGINWFHGPIGNISSGYGDAARIEDISQEKSSVVVDS